MGRQIALKLRTKLQALFFKLGCFSQRHCWAVLAVGFFILIGFSVGLIKAKIETDVEKLWVEVDGRLEKELQYTKDAVGEGSGTTNELLIHKSNSGLGNILSVGLLQEHLEKVQKAIDVKVTMYNKTWTHTDLCYVPEVPSFNNSLVDGVVSSIVPCLIISPLDCFWDGAKLLKLRGSLPDEIKSVAGLLEWTASHPEQLLGLLPLLGDIQGIEEIAEMFLKAGIVNGYQDRPCLDPTETGCPSTAPNSPTKSGKPPNVAKELTGGCKGFATEFMQWAEELVVGGTEKDNNTLTSAKALQTILVLTGTKDLHKRWADSSEYLTVDWTKDSAKEVLEAWQRKFTEEINNDVQETEEFSMLAFDSASVTDLLKEFSQTSASRIAIGYVLMLIYACITLKRWCDPIHSHGALGLAGVLLVTLSVAAGLGFCALCGITFNAASTQVLPFLALGLGVDDMFLLAHSYSTLTHRGEIRSKDEVGYCLGTIGVSVFLTSFNNMLAFFMAAFIRIPALRHFAIQAGVVVIFNFIGVIIIFPAMISLDIRRRKAQRWDIICCQKQPQQEKGSVEVITGDVATTNGVHSVNSRTELSANPVTPQPTQTMVMTVPAKNKSDSSIADVLVNEYASNGDKQSKNSYGSEASVTGNHVNSTAMEMPHPVTTRNNGNSGKSSAARCGRFLLLEYFATTYYGPFLRENPVKVAVLILFAGLLAVGIYGSFQVEDGLELTEVVPQGSVAHQFVEAQFKYFSFYPMSLITQEGFDYANRQKTLYSYHEAFKEIPNIIRIPDSEEIPKFWMMYFRDWLRDIQTAFNQEWANKTITYSGWKENATDNGVIAFKLLSQTGNGDEIDRSKVRNYTLVSDDGVIRPEIFYKALTLWVDRDVLGYAFSQASIKPETVDWSNVRSPQDDAAMQVPTAKPITFAKINFNVIGLKETKDFVALIKNVREICDRFSADGLPNYPSGVPFTFWEQYIWLRRQIYIAISIALAVSFVVMAVMLFNIWAAALITLVLLMITVEMYGFMGLAGINLSAVPAVTLILSVGVGVEFTVHMCLAFLHTLGNRNERMQKAIEHVFVPIVDGAISTFLGVVMLAGSPFQFIVRYFFNLLVALILIGTFNGLLFLPVLLSIVGPGAVAQEINTPDANASIAFQNKAMDASSAESAINSLEGEQNEMGVIKQGENKLRDHSPTVGRTVMNVKHGSQVEPAENDPRAASIGTSDDLNAKSMNIKR